MKIVLISLANTYETVISQLESEGHSVLHITEKDGVYGGNSSAISTLETVISNFNPDIVVNNMPSVSLSNTSNFTYVANTQASADLELKKWETRQKAKELGFLLPTVLEECTMNTVSTAHTDTVFLKAKDVDPWHQSWKIPAGTDIATHNKHFPPSIPAFVEADVGHDIEGNCMFTMHNGSYTINKTTGYTGRGNEKVLSGKGDWKEGTEFKDLTSEQETAFLSLCTTWLNYAATLGGSYQGEICAGIKGTDVYWFEQNSRRSTYGSFVGTGQNWLDSLKSDSSKSSETRWDYNF